ncbi:MAG: tetratricopeptide repeat protein [Phycisphaerae bacterium]|nr:tetratricopeptide repeat protein [Phycisphaerae bacterium]
MILMDGQYVAGRRLVDMARPYLDEGDRDGLARRLKTDWSPDCLTLLLSSDDVEVVEIAVTGLGLIGDMVVCPVVAKLLHHENPSVVASAEDALWSIWFRVGGALGQAVLCRIAESIQSGESENVVAMLTEVIRVQPSYAEAYHQRSQAYYLDNAFDHALRDARRAFELNPWHFGALANQAHALAALGHLREALQAYRKVLQLHPQMPGIRLSIRHLRDRLALVGA